MSEHKGSYILQLLNSLSPAPLSDNVRHLYNEANRERTSDIERAIKLCKDALVVLEEQSRNSLIVSDAKGRCHLLLASIYLNIEDQENLEKAKENYLHSKDAYNLAQHSHFISLAFLGLAITLRKLDEFTEASDACEQAQKYINDYSPPTGIDKRELCRAIHTERLEIHNKISSVEKKPAKTVDEIQLPIFKISSGDKLLAAGRRRSTSLNLLSRKDYEQHISRKPEVAIIDLKKRPSAQNAAYILEIDENVELSEGLEQGNWLFIDERPTKLNNGKTVAVLMRERNRISVSLKTFIKDRDHFFLKSERGTSVIIAYRKSNFATIRNDYSIYQERVVGKLVHDVQVSGPVIRNPVPPQIIAEITKAFIWPIPIFSDIVVLSDQSFTEDVKYKDIRRSEHMDTGYFGVDIHDDSMKDDGILPGCIALIRQQRDVENGDIAALIITRDRNPEAPLRLLRRYYRDVRPGREHWFLRASNSENLVIVPSGGNVQTITDLYRGQDQSFEIYEGAEIVIVGRYMGLLDEE